MSAFVVILIAGLLLIKYVQKNTKWPDIPKDRFPDISETPNPYQPKETVTPPPPSKPVTRTKPAVSEASGNVAQNLAESVATPRKKEVGQLYGIIGNPLGHSKSSFHFKRLFRDLGLDADYLNFELESVEQLPDLVKRYPNLKGLNVTIPYKTEVMKFMDRLDETASEVGAVNVIKVERSGESVQLVGYNTDAAGFTESLRPLLAERGKALILGTGGVSKAVAYGLRQLGVEYKFVSRNSTFDILGYYELSPSIMDEHTLIVNCTPLGMPPLEHEYPDIPYAHLSANHLLYDVVYTPDDTLFLQKGRYYGTATKNGYEMWQRQAEETWRIWKS